MGWLDSGASCKGNKRYECTYEVFYGYPDAGYQYCKDYDSYCPSWDDNAGLVDVKDNQAGGGDGGGW